MKVSIVSLGCSKNLVDTELILGSLKKVGYEISASEADADIIIVNTCGFIGDAKRESINTIIELAEYKNRGKCKRLIVTGCLVERYADELKRELPEVDSFWGTGNLTKIGEVLKKEKLKKIYKSPPGTLYDPDTPRILTTPSYTAYVKVSEGCSRTCSFCIIPKMRGPMKSRPVRSIVEEAKRLSDQGVKEINLIAQDMTSYGRDIGTNLETLLRELAKVEGIRWIRILYCYPWGFTDSLINLIAEEDKILPYIDMPIQHINDRILKLMNRKTTRSDIEDIIYRLRTKIPDLTLRTTFIVGFPGETDREFEELLEFIKEVRFERVGAFKYSREEGTKAGEMAEQIPEEVKEERFERLMEIQSEISLQKNLQLIGTFHEAFIEGVESNSYLARIPSQAPEVDGITYVERNRRLSTGELVRVRITDADIYDLFGETVSLPN
ncbi:MAG: ribosomal protein S12 methylthiotransferase RimO [Deltaproteobacteria bacterium]|jgi:ribosomal protein S12 methylthiotransferase|nr:MAG: ribosomal protein S12 methylthiotransferase RimO [Deltaproteobacteria bacterium]